MVQFQALKLQTATKENCGLVLHCDSISMQPFFYIISLPILDTLQKNKFFAG
jgi:hypothetical protein